MLKTLLRPTLIHNAHLAASISDMSLYVFNAHPGFGDANGPTAAAPDPTLSTEAAVAMVVLDFSMRLIAITKTG